MTAGTIFTGPERPWLERVAEAISVRHADDLVIAECKDGPTWGAEHIRFDYWVLRRSWSKPAMIGYEVKSSRADFLSDEKWHRYLPLCNLLSFIAPPDAIFPNELTAGVGLLRLAGSRLITVRKAAHRQIEPPVDLMTYILMSRMRIHAGYEAESKARYWRDWLEERRGDLARGHAVSKRLRQLIDERIETVESENSGLRIRCEHLEAIRAALERVGIDPLAYPEDVVERLMPSRWTRTKVRNLRDELTELLGPDEACG